MIGTNRELESIGRMLDCRILELSRLARGTPERASASRQLTALIRQRLAVSAVLANRRIEASEKVVEFSRWLTGDGALFDAVAAADRVTRFRRRPVPRHPS
jgi:hypothetical protein